jgi:amino acid transporter
MSKSNPKLRLPLYAILAATIMLLAFVLFVLQLNEPAIRWAELFISRFLR